MAYAMINYGGGGRAEIWGDFDRDNAVSAFYSMANECFGIRKSIMDDQLLDFDENAAMPKPWSKLEGAAKMLRHNCGGWPMYDIIVWDAAGEKIKSEWD